MAKRREPQMTVTDWLTLARSKKVRKRIASDDGIDTFQGIIRIVARRSTLDWDEAVGILHMVYGWMPTMLKKIGMQLPSERSKLIASLSKVRKGDSLSSDELTEVQQFSNHSIVGASKLLHVLNPDSYPIWDDRVAQAFLWRGVTRQTFATLDRYIEYMTTLRDWELTLDVLTFCAEIRNLNPGLANAGNLRLIELVMFRSVK